MSAFKNSPLKQPNKKQNKVEEITVSSKHLVLRIILFVLFLGIGISGIVVGCTYNNNHLDTGWYNVECIEGQTDANNFRLSCYYNDGKKENANLNKAITKLYTQLCNKAYALFHETRTSDLIVNLKDINSNPNEDIRVESDLYNVFKTILDNDSKVIYYGPVYDTYSNLFSADSDIQAKESDPYYSTKVKDFFDEVSSYVTNDKVKVVLKENNVLRLEVSDDYLTYCNENGITNFVSFNYLHNAITVDFIADKLIEANVSDFRIYSYDGYYRSYYKNDSLSDSYFMRTYYNDYIIPEAKINFKKSTTFVEFKTFPISAGEDSYLYENKKFAHHFLNDECLYTSCCESLLLYKNESASTLDLLLKGTKIFTGSTLDVNGLKAIANFVYNEGNVVKYNDASLEMTDLFDKDGMTFTKELI